MGVQWSFAVLPPGLLVAGGHCCLPWTASHAGSSDSQILPAAIARLRHSSAVLGLVTEEKSG
jgi:hypothetical protein